ncbi:hypothetical protein ABZX30_05520 [Streptomyces sp. NPDC004542]|uniref:hypothetical protein n=1 Tax=Streptomyces sp. NPDC004542 TaxID=3154281 RepID=UPI0033A66E56
MGSAVPTAELDGVFEGLGGPASEEVADAVAYVTSRPRPVTLRQIMVPPTRQA